MERKLLFAAAVLLSLPFLSFGAIVGISDPNLLTHNIDWCVNFGCAGNQLSTPQPWTGSSGTTGNVGLIVFAEGFYNLQQGTTWNGNFDPGMGLIYNGVAFGNHAVPIRVDFNEGQYGAGAWIQSNYFGDFLSTLTAFDVNHQPIFSFSLPGVSNTQPGTALFIGVMSTLPEIYGLHFTAAGIGPNEPDFAIGMVKYGVVPEPSSLLLMGAGLLALGAFARRRRS